MVPCTRHPFYAPNVWKSFVLNVLWFDFKLLRRAVCAVSAVFVVDERNRFSISRTFFIVIILLLSWRLRATVRRRNNSNDRDDETVVVGVWGCEGGGAPESIKSKIAVNPENSVLYICINNGRILFRYFSIKNASVHGCGKSAEESPPKTGWQECGTVAAAAVVEHRSWIQ